MASSSPRTARCRTRSVHSRGLRDSPAAANRSATPVSSLRPVEDPRRAHGNRCGQFLVEAELTPGGRQRLRAQSGRGDLQIAALPADRPYGPDTGRGPSLRQAPRSLDDHPELADRPPHEPTRHPNTLEPAPLGRTPGREFPHRGSGRTSRPQRGFFVHWCHGSGRARLGSRCLAGRSSSRLPTADWCGSPLACGPAGHRWRGVAQAGSARLEEALPTPPIRRRCSGEREGGSLARRDCVAMGASIEV